MNSVKISEREIFPSKIVCIGRNYVEHIKELGNEIPEEPVIFIKPNSSLSNEIYSGRNHSIHYESEISFLIMEKKIKGVGFGLDLTKREVQSALKKKGLPWERAKSFNGAAVFSDFVPFEGDTSELFLTLLINDREIQKGGVNLMIYKPLDLLKEAEKFLGFEDGDIIMTGTPKGVGPLKKGDRFSGMIFNGSKMLLKKEWIVN